MYSIGGVAERMKIGIFIKLKAAGAFSREKAVTPKEAKLTPSESNWIVYFAGGITSKIRKTREGKFYIRK
jgi:hypothetical protein